MNKIILYLVLILVATSFCSGAVFAGEKPVGKIIGIIGMVEYRVPSGSESVADSQTGSVKPVSFTPWEKAKPHQLVYASDIYRTSRKSRLKVLFNDQSLIALGPKSEMKVQSYIYKPGEKLRQGVINVTQGLSMYLINKSQKNKDSSFRVVTPTANISARGTQGFTSSSGSQTLVANQSGAVDASNSDVNVKGHQLVEAMMNSIIKLGEAPTPPEALTEAELAQIRILVIGLFGTEYAGSDLTFEEIFELFDDTFSESCTF